MYNLLIEIPKFKLVHLILGKKKKKKLKTYALQLFHPFPKDQFKGINESPVFT